ncbi:MAG: type II toxin-antitoxin system VapC family toxin [Terriglobales bacterium]
MIILDTNVLSELMRLMPSSRVAGWVAKQAPEELFTTSVTEAEIFYGIELLAASKRRESLLSAAEKMFTRVLQGRVLAFESEAARPFARIVARRRALGCPVGHADAQIAAIAQVHSAALATRHSDDFEDCGVTVVNPWIAS